MDETFSFQTTARQRRMDPAAIKLAVTAGVLLLAVVSFGRWVTDSEDASFARLRSDTTAPQHETEPAAAKVDPAGDAQAQVTALTALGIAQRTLADSVTFADASPDRLNSLQTALMFQVGPSTGPSVVSISATDSAWAAAVLSPGGSCYYVRLAGGDRISYGTGPECSGDAALAAGDQNWPTSASVLPPHGFAQFNTQD